MVDEGSTGEFTDEAHSSAPKRHRLRTGLVLSLGAGLALAAGGVALAQNDPTPKHEAVPDGPAPYGFGVRGPMPMGGPLLDGSLLGAVGSALHGEVTIAKGDGGFETLKLQRGAVTAVSHSSLTLKSDDGFTQTYTVTDDTLVNGGRDGIGSIVTGHDVGVTAVVNGGTTELRQVVDTTLIKKHFDEFMGPHGPLSELRKHFRDRVDGWLDEHSSTSGSSTVYNG